MGRTRVVGQKETYITRMTDLMITDHIVFYLLVDHIFGIQSFLFVQKFPRPSLQTMMTQWGSDIHTLPFLSCRSFCYATLSFISLFWNMILNFATSICSTGCDNIAGLRCQLEAKILFIVFLDLSLLSLQNITYNFLLKL